MYDKKPQQIMQNVSLHLAAWLKLLPLNHTPQTCLKHNGNGNISKRYFARIILLIKNSNMFMFPDKIVKYFYVSQ